MPDSSVASAFLNCSCSRVAAFMHARREVLSAQRLAYSVREAAEILGASEWLIREQCRQNKIGHTKVGGRTLISARSLEDLIGRPMATVERAVDSRTRVILPHLQGPSKCDVCGSIRSCH